MIVYNRDNATLVDIFWEDLSAEAQTELFNLIGDNGNYDVFPIVSINVSQEEDNEQQS